MKYLTILSILLLFSFSCTKENKKSIESCCELSSIQEEIGIGEIYVPNIFTPDGDGINDLFAINGIEIKNITDFIIINNENEVVFEKELIMANDYSNGWDGSVNGIIDYGLFSYSFTVESNDGISKFIEGEVCAWICKEVGQTEPKSPKNLTDCHFPAHHDGNGGFDPTKPSHQGIPCF